MGKAGRELVVRASSRTKGGKKICTGSNLRS